MSYNGSGTFTINSTGQPVVAGTVITASAFNALTADLATGLTTAITKDGQTTTTARIPFAQGINSSLVTDSSSTSTGSIITAGGVGIAKALYVGGNLNVTGTVNSPTLVTPALGTPASGVMTNVTGINYDGYKSRIINGAMVIDQRNAGAAVTATGGNGVYAVDRFNTSISTGSCTAQQSTTVPVGFNYSLSLTVGTSGTPSASAQNTIQQVIEGFNMADFGWGTANAKQVTLSFWVRSSLTGTFAVAFQNVNYDRFYVSTYTINAANTWEQKSITLTGDTTGTWNSTNGSGIRLKFDMGYGSNFNTTANAWGAGEFYTVSGTTKLVANSAATFYITGVQLEKGSTATSFDYRPYGTELALCQRYFQKSYSAATAVATVTFVGMEWMSLASTYSGRMANTTHLVQSMRDPPSITPYDQAGTANRVRTSAGNGQTGYNIQTISTEKFVMDYNALINELLYHWTASAEL